jgi:hypothetical protein
LGDGRLEVRAEMEEPRVQTILEEVRQWNGVDSREEALAFLDMLCASYLQADPVLRNNIRQAVAANPPVYPRLLYDSTGAVGAGPCLMFAAERAQATNDYVIYLRATLVTIALTGGLGDWRDTIAWLERHYEEAHKRGIDPRPHIEELALLADSQNQHGISRMSTRDLILSAGGLCWFGGEVLEKAEVIRRLLMAPSQPDDESFLLPEHPPDL